MSKETAAHIHLPANSKANPRKASAYKLRRGSLQEQNSLSRLSVGVSEQFVNARNAFSRLPTPGSSNSGMQEPISKQMRRRIPKNYDNRSRRRDTDQKSQAEEHAGMKRRHHAKSHQSLSRPGDQARIAPERNKQARTRGTYPETPARSEAERVNRVPETDLRRRINLRAGERDRERETWREGEASRDGDGGGGRGGGGRPAGGATDRRARALERERERPRGMDSERVDASSTEGVRRERARPHL